jgi:hypothetical protein
MPASFSMALRPPSLTTAPFTQTPASPTATTAQLVRGLKSPPHSVNLVAVSCSTDARPELPNPSAATRFTNSMITKVHEAMYGVAPKVRPPPVIAFTALLFIPVAFALCVLIVRKVSYEDFLGFDILRAFWWSHGTASAILLGLSIWSLRRHERCTWLGYLLMVAACAWLPMTIAIRQWYI